MLLYSTISSVVNSLAAVTLEDFVKRFLWKDISEEKAAIVSKCLGNIPIYPFTHL